MLCIDLIIENQQAPKRLTDQAINIDDVVSS